jgi:hypothetical protein
MVRPGRVDRGHRLDENPPVRFGRVLRPPTSRHLPHQPMQPDHLGGYLWTTLVSDRFAVDERESTQRSDSLVEPVAREL